MRAGDFYIPTRTVYCDKMKVNASHFYAGQVFVMSGKGVLLLNNDDRNCGN